MGLWQTASPSQTAASRAAFWPPHCSPSSASCFIRQKRTCQMASTSVSKQMAMSSTFSILHARKPPRNSSLSCCLLTTVFFSPLWRKPYSTSSTTSFMQPRTLASPSAWRRLRKGTNPLPVRHTVLLHQYRWHQPKHSGTLHLPG